jgi:hypothetical protein
MRLYIPILCILAVGSARAAGDVKQANELFGKMRYVKALKVAESALEDPKNGPMELVGVYRIMGLCQSALGKTKKALDTFRKLLAVDPSFRLSREISPKLAAPFYQAVAMIQEGEQVALKHKTPGSPDSLQGLKLTARLQANPFGMVKNIRFRFRLSTAEKERMIVHKVVGSGAQEARILLPAGLKADKIMYFFEAVNQYGGTLARAGSYHQPFRLKAKPAPKPMIAPVPPVVVKKKPEPKIALPVITPKPIILPPPKRKEEKAEPENGQDAAWYHTWWFWTAMGVVVAGATTGIVLATTGTEPSGPVDYKFRTQYPE